MANHDVRITFRGNALSICAVAEMCIDPGEGALHIAVSLNIEEMLIVSVVIQMQCFMLSSASCGQCISTVSSCVCTLLDNYCKPDKSSSLAFPLVMDFSKALTCHSSK